MRFSGRDYYNRMLCLICLLVLYSSTAGEASAFRSNGLGARARGMGGAYVAIADDTTAGFWNPAGLAYAEGALTQLEIKPEWINVDYTPPGGDIERNQPETLIIPALGANLPLRHGRVPMLELLAYVPYGLELEWDEDAPYRYNATRDRIRVLSAGAAMAYRASDHVAVGIAAFVNEGRLEVMNMVPSTVYAGMPGLPDATFTAIGSDRSPNIHLGAMWRVNRKATLGATYRSPIELRVHGDASLAIQDSPTIIDQWETPLELPQSVSLGAAWQATPDLLVAGQADWVDWSSIDQQALVFRQGNLPNQMIARDWRNRVQLRMGVEYSAQEHLVLRAGYSYDPTPVPATTLDPLLLDLNRHIISVGVGTSGHRWAFDVSYEHFCGQPRETMTSTLTFPTNGRYTGRVDVLTLTVSYLN